MDANDLRNIRSRNVHVKLTEAEFQALRRAARDDDRGASSFLRQLAMSEIRRRETGNGQSQIG
jgi:hypothetical protein